ncbi:acyl carrier protein [Mesorhizobium soli]|uniref:Acyl carrier protein n=1 Tax=Pseudaminobacter soli (ex Li et al. 2025) TaxID=1295366 RepID=A0A2P7SE31_9HYPH|nr:acyl carrier protein [Mesorhizobium soli]
MMSTYDRVKKIIVEHIGADPDKITEEASFEDDLEMDSLDRVELVQAAEAAFGVEIEDDEAEAFQKVSDAIKCIDGKQTVTARPATDKLADAVRAANERLAALSPEEQKAHWQAQRESFVRGQIDMGNDKQEAEARAAYRSGG